MYASKKRLAFACKRTPGAANAVPQQGKLSLVPVYEGLISPFETQLQHEWHLQQQHLQHQGSVMDSDDPVADNFSEMSEGCGTEQEEEENNAMQSTDDMECEPELPHGNSLMSNTAAEVAAIEAATAAVAAAADTEFPTTPCAGSSSSSSISSTVHRSPAEELQQLWGKTKQELETDCNALEQQLSGSNMPSTPPPSPITPQLQQEQQQCHFAQQLQLEQVAQQLLTVQLGTAAMVAAAPAGF